PRLHLWWGPAQALVVEAFGQRRLDDLEVGGEVEVGRGVEAVVADVKELAAAELAEAVRGGLVDALDARPDGIAEAGEGFGDQVGADRPRRLARAERDHAAAPA